MIIQVTDGDNTLSRNESALNLKLARLIVETKRRPRPDVKVRHTDGGVGREGGVVETRGVVFVVVVDVDLFISSFSDRGLYYKVFLLNYGPMIVSKMFIALKILILIFCQRIDLTNILTSVCNRFDQTIF